MKTSSQNSEPTQEKGAALLTVLVAVMIITLMLFEFQFRTEVERRLAYNDLDRIRAYYLAKSAVNIGLLRLTLYGRAQNSPAALNNKNFPVQQYLDKIWNLPLPPFPPTEEEVKAMGERTDKSNAQEVLKQTKVVDGRFYQTIQSESSKINLNHLVVPKDKLEDQPDFTREPQALYEHVGRLLINLLENFMRDSEDPYAEFGNLKPDELVMDIMDWVNPGDNRFAGGFKDAWYERQVPPYRAKRNRFYTVEELKMVKDIDEKLYKKIKPFITVHSWGGQININTARKDVLKAIYPDLTEDDLKELIKHRDEIKGFSSTTQFISYISDTLNRPGIKEYYSKPEDYPFTVSNESFVIEGTGEIAKSASSVQSRITVTVALRHQSRGGQKAPASVKPADCKDQYFVDPRNNQCTYVPTNEEECIKIAAQWKPEGSRNCCFIERPAKTICPPTGASSGGGKTTEPPNAMKILTWMES